MNTEILSTHSQALFQEAVGRAAHWLRSGGVVALPTETVYGLAANALDPSAVARIYQIKGRPAHNPLIVHVASQALLEDLFHPLPAMVEKLARAFWPGPLTMVLPNSGKIPEIVTAGGQTVAVRWPSHPFMQAVIRECGFPLAAPSANLSNHISPTHADHVCAHLMGLIPLIVDGGQSQVGIESTVLDLTSSPPAILRPGMIHAGSLASVLGLMPTTAKPQNGILKSPGQLSRHYSPKARVLVWSWTGESHLRKQLADSSLVPASTQILAHTCIPSDTGLAGVSVIPHDAEAFARALFAEWHRCDARGIRHIIVESPPDTPEWAGIWDRLLRASA